MVKLLSRAWRDELACVASSANQSVLVVAPFIKYAEASWFCNLLRPGVEVITLSNLDPSAVGAGSLDLNALRCLAEASISSRLVALSNLHAKVFVADETAAIVTSGNLTKSALDSNFEYGVLFREASVVTDIRNDMLSFARLGSELDVETIAELVPLETELRQVYAEVVALETPASKLKFTEVLRQAKPAFAATQVGGRSSYAVFGEAIQFVLAQGPQTTKAIQLEVSRLLPALCDETEVFFIKGEPYGKAWKRRFRHVQLDLRRKGILEYDRRTKLWALPRQTGEAQGFVVIK